MNGCLGVIIGNRGVFPGSLVEKGRKEVVDALRKKGIEAILPPAKETKYGAVESYKEAKKWAKLFSKNRERIDGILVGLPNFGDERAVADTIRMSTLSVPVLIQAYPGEIDKMDIKNRRDSFCGKLSVCSNLDQHRIPFSLTRLHTVSPLSKEFSLDLEWFMKVCRLVKGLKRARVGIVGARTTPFNTVRFSERLLEHNGISVETMDLSGILLGVKTLKDSDRKVGEKLSELSSFSNQKNMPASVLLNIAKLTVVLTQWMKESELNACAFRCWPELQDSLGVFPCVSMSMLTSSLLPCACETDVMGALAMYALQLASGLPSGLFDWNNNYGDDPDKAVLFHCSNLPQEMLERPSLECNATDANFRGTPEKSYGTLAGRVKPGPMTFAKLSADDIKGNIVSYIGEGEFTSDSLSSFGAVGVVKIKGLQELLQYLSRKGFEHHVAVSLSYVGRALKEAFSNYLGWEVYYHD